MFRIVLPSEFFDDMLTATAFPYGGYRGRNGGMNHCFVRRGAPCGPREHSGFRCGVSEDDSSQGCRRARPFGGPRGMEIIDFKLKLVDEKLANNEKSMDGLVKQHETLMNKKEKLLQVKERQEQAMQEAKACRKAAWLKFMQEKTKAAAHVEESTCMIQGMDGKMYKVYANPVHVDDEDKKQRSTKGSDANGANEALIGNEGSENSVPKHRATDSVPFANFSEYMQAVAMQAIYDLESQGETNFNEKKHDATEVEKNEDGAANKKDDTRVSEGRKKDARGDDFSNLLEFAQVAAMEIMDNMAKLNNLQGDADKKEGASGKQVTEKTVHSDSGNTKSQSVLASNKTQVEVEDVNDEENKQWEDVIADDTLLVHSSEDESWMEPVQYDAPEEAETKSGENQSDAK